MPSKKKKSQKSKSADQSLASNFDRGSKSSMPSRLSRSTQSQSFSIQNLSREIDLHFSGDIDEILVDRTADAYATIASSLSQELRLPDTSIDITQMLLHASISSIEDLGSPKPTWPCLEQDKAEPPMLKPERASEPTLPLAVVHVAEQSTLLEITCFADPEDLDEDVIAEAQSRSSQVEAARSRQAKTLDGATLGTGSASFLLLSQSQDCPHAQNLLGCRESSLKIQPLDLYPTSMPTSSLSPSCAAADTLFSLDGAIRKSATTGRFCYFDKEAERKPQLSLRRSQSLLAGVSDPIFALDPEGSAGRRPSQPEVSLGLELAAIALAEPALLVPSQQVNAKQAVIEEFKEREHDFGNNLKLLQNFIMNVAIADRDKRILVAGLPELAALSDKLAQGLSLAVANYDATHSTVGSLFLELKSEFEIYRAYIQNYNSVRNRNEFLQNESLVYRNAVDMLKRDETVNRNRHDMSAFFMLPIQQLTRYTIFFQTLVKHCQDDDKDCGSINSAYAFLKAFTAEMNSLRARDESQTRIFSIIKDVKDCPADMVSDKRLWIKEMDAIQYATFDRKPRRVRIYLFSDIILVARVAYKDQSSDMKRAEREGRLVAPPRKFKPLLTFWYSVSRSGLSQVLSGDLAAEESKSAHKDSLKPRYQLQLGFDRIHVKMSEIFHRQHGSSKLQGLGTAASHGNPSTLSRTASTKKKLFGFGPRISPSKSTAQQMSGEAFAASRLDFQASNLSIRTHSNLSMMTRYQDSTTSSFQSSYGHVSKLGSFLPNSPASLVDGNAMDRVDFRVKEARDRDEMYHELFGKINELLMSSPINEQHAEDSFMVERADSHTSSLRERPSPLFSSPSQAWEIQSSA